MMQRPEPVTNIEYEMAVADLAGSGLGSVVEIKVRHAQPTNVYLKPQPSMDAYDKMNELQLPIDVVQYEAKFHKSAPVAITKNMKEELAELVESFRKA